MDWQERITVNPGVRSGKPCIKGTRITVYDVLEYLAGGMSEDQILADFPDLSREDIRASLAFAAARATRAALPSRPTTSDPRRAMASAKLPMPHKRSATRSPGCGSSSPIARRTRTRSTA